MKLSRKTAFYSFLISLGVFILLIGFSLLFVFRSELSESPVFDGKRREIGFPVKRESVNAAVFAFDENGIFSSAVLFRLDKETKAVTYTFFEKDWIIEKDGSGFYLKSLIKDTESLCKVLSSVTGCKLNECDCHALSDLKSDFLSAKDAFVKTLATENSERLFGQPMPPASMTEKKIVLIRNGDFETIDLQKTLDEFGFALLSEK